MENYLPKQAIDPDRLVHIPQLNNKGFLRQMKVYYPDGEVTPILGVYRGLTPLPDGSAYVLINVAATPRQMEATQAVNEIVCVDPLAVIITTEGGRVLYSPHLPEVQPYLNDHMKAWLHNNPHWPRVLDLSQRDGHYWVL